MAQNGVIMDGLKDKWHISLLRKTHGIKLQKNPNTKHACGRPGINGGFIDNPYVKFGANCLWYQTTKTIWMVTICIL